MEFQKIMHEWKRMCAATSFCEVCPLKDEKCWATSPANMVGNSKSIEAIIMAWAAEHPEPKYPTWGEWLNSLHVVGVHAMQAPSQNLYYPIVDKMNTPIPADIAQKLELQPKEG